MDLPNLVSYLPMDRWHSLLTGQPLPDRSSGAALFADISGFTPLAEALAVQLGPQRAAEELTHQLNQVYDAIISQVHCYRGSVIGFVGDAITCWFDEQAAGGKPQNARTASAGLLSSASPKPPLAAWRAVTCATACQQAMAPFAQAEVTAGVTASLAIKVGIAAGPVRRFRVGDPAIQYIDVLAGNTLRWMSQAEGQACKGEVLLDESAAAPLQDHLAICQWRVHPDSGRRLAVVSELSVPAEPTPATLGAEACAPVEDQLRTWILPPLYARLEAGQSRFLAELRPAVSLFLRFGGIDYDDDPAAGDKLDAYIRWVQQVVYRYEGSLIQLTIGDKGSFLYAAFGAPIAHDDDAIRAVRAALELQSPPPEVDFITGTQIGLAQGQARTGAYGGRTRRSYGVIGNDAVLAARLMTAAPPGEIRCAHSIYAQAGRRIPFESLPPVRVKGRANLIRVYRPADEKDQSPSTGAAFHPLVGRLAEVATLEACLDAVVAGETRLLVVEGEAGIGKSRLIDELKRLARERGLAGLLGAGQSIEQRVPYRAWRDVFSSYFAIDDVTEAAERRQRVAAVVQQVAPDQAQRLPLLNDVLYLGFDDNELTKSLDPSLRQQSLMMLLASLLQAWARSQPLLVVLEDAHWLDDLSWQLADRAARLLAAHGLPFLLVIVNRPLEEDSPGRHSLKRWQTTDRCCTIHLDRLDPGEIVELLAQRLNIAVGELPPAVAELVQSRSGGNPFFAEELTFALRDLGIITVDPVLALEGGQVRITGDLGHTQQTLPDTLHGLVLSRLDRLPPERQLILKVAAVIGRTFAFTPLQHALGQYVPTPPLDLRAQLQALNAADFTFVETMEPDLAYAFKHIITQEAAYQTLLFAQRRELHEIIAAWYERQPGLQAYLPLLVHHYHQAERADKERDYAGQAGEQAARQFANASAVRYFSRALELTPKTEMNKRYELLLGREEVYDVLGEREAQGEDLSELAGLTAAMADTPADASAWAHSANVTLRQARYARSLGDYPAALEAVQRALAQSERAHDLNSKMQGLYEWGRILWKQGYYQLAQAQLEQALELARAGQQHPAEAHSLYDLGTVFYQQANYAAAQACYEQALAIYQALSHKPGQTQCWLMFGTLHYTAGEYVAAQEDYEQALSISQSIGWRYSEASILTNLGNNCFDLGNYRDSQSYHERALAISREISHREDEAISLDTLGLIHTFLGDYQAAQAYGQQALAIQRDMDDRYSQAYTLNHLGLVWTGLNDLARAAEAFGEALHLRRELGQADLAMDDMAGLARVALAQGHIAQARPHVEEILAWLAGHSPDGVEFPVLVYLTCYRFFQAEGFDAAAFEILHKGYALLMERAGRIRDETLRQQFLESVPFNQELLACFPPPLRGGSL